VDLGDRQAELAKLELAERTLERTWLFLERGDASLLMEVGGPTTAGLPAVVRSSSWALSRSLLIRVRRFHLGTELEVLPWCQVSERGRRADHGPVSRM